MGCPAHVPSPVFSQAETINRGLCYCRHKAKGHRNVQSKRPGGLPRSGRGQDQPHRQQVHGGNQLRLLQGLHSEQQYHADCSGKERPECRTAPSRQQGQGLSDTRGTEERHGQAGLRRPELEPAVQGLHRQDEESGSEGCRRCPPRASGYRTQEGSAPSANAA